MKSIGPILGLLAISVLCAPVAHAQIAPLNGAQCAFFGVFCPPGVMAANTGTLSGVLLGILNAFLVLTGIIATIFVVYAGFRYITSQGNEETIRSAKTQLTFAVVGIVVILLATTIVNSTLALNFAPLEASLRGVLNAFLVLTGVIATIYLTYAGFKYITSQGNQEAAEQAKRQIIFGVVGIFVVTLAGTIVNSTLATNFLPLEASIQGILNALLVLVGTIATAYLMYAGITYITSQGDEEKAAQAKRQIVFAVLGMTVIILAGTIVNSTLATNFLPLQLSIVTILNALLILVGITATAFLMYAGVLYITSQGDEEQATRARRQIIYALIGIVVVLARFSLPGSFTFTPGGGTVNFAFFTAELTTVVNAFTALIGITATIFLIYAGLRYITSQGDEEAAKAARNQIIYAVIGLVIVILRFAIPASFTLTPGGGVVDFTNLSNTVQGIINAFLVLIGLTALIFTIYAGVRYITSQGDEEAAAAARRQIIYGVIGLIVVGIAGTIVNTTQALDFAPLTQSVITIINAFLGLVGTVALIYLIYSGVLYIVSTGDEQIAAQAKRQILYAVIGLIVVGLSWAIVAFVIQAVP